MPGDQGWRGDGIGEEGVSDVKITVVRCDSDSAAAIRVVVDGKLIGVGTIGDGQPEDAIEYRDYKWIKEMLRDLAVSLGADAAISEAKTEQFSWNEHGAGYDRLARNAFHAKAWSSELLDEEKP